MLATVSVELSVNRNNLSPTRYVSAGIVNSPATTPFLSAVNVPPNAGTAEPTAEILPFAFAEPIPVNTSPVVNAPACDTVLPLKGSPVPSPETEPTIVIAVAIVPEILFIVIVLLVALNDSNVEVIVSVPSVNVTVSPIVKPEAALDKVTSCVISEIRTVEAF